MQSPWLSVGGQRAGGEGERMDPEGQMEKIQHPSEVSK